VPSNQLLPPVNGKKLRDFTQVNSHSNGTPTLGESLVSPPSEIQIERRRGRARDPPRQGADDRNGAPTSGRASEEGAAKRLDRTLSAGRSSIEHRHALTFLLIFGSPLRMKNEIAWRKPT
jgi:hypothetical protein